MRKPLVLFIILSITCGLSFSACTLLSKQYKGETSDHFDGDYFHNPVTADNDKRSPIEFLTWFFNRKPEPWKNLPAKKYTHLSPQTDELTITWINHATVLIQLNNTNILTDPIWSERASPLSWIGPKRKAPTPIPLNKLPRIDAVVISHNHYDHMDLPSLQRLNERHQPIFITPLANQHYLRNIGITKIKELDWWQNMTIKNISITATPAQHWSKRTLFDANRALWSGFYLKGHEQSVYYSGDTAYEALFKQVKNKLGPPTVALLPIGAYKPLWFMQRAHINPAQAVLAHIELEAKTSIPVHFGTFQLGDDNPQSALSDLKQAIAQHQLNTDAFNVLKPGETVAISRQSSLAKRQ